MADLDLEQIHDSPHLLDILLQMEDVLDSMDLYVFRNWLKGEVAEGPNVRRYWLDFTLRYAHKDMPDPRGALRLLKHGIRVDYQKGRQENTESDEEFEGDEPREEDLMWLVKISIPRRLVVQMDAAEHDFYDDEIDIDQVEDAKDDGMDDESGFDGEEQTEEGGAPPPPGPDGEPAEEPAR
jgi:hypothetical protein